MYKPLCLVGLMGSGKSTLAATVGETLGWKVLDTDRWIEEEEKNSVQQIVAAKGWEYFREKESDFCRNFKTTGPCLISTGGGFPMSPFNFQWLFDHALTVYLQVSPEIAAERISRQESLLPGSRPLMGGLNSHDLLNKLRKLYGERSPIYEKFPFSVNADAPLDQVAEALVKISAIAQTE